MLTNTCPQNNYKFEGKERDIETGNDDFGARYYSNRFDRWLSPDWSNVPVAVPYANLTNPQTLNLYSMVADDPESFADLDGHEGDSGTLPQGECKGASDCISQASQDNFNKDSAEFHQRKNGQNAQQPQERGSAISGLSEKDPGLPPSPAAPSPPVLVNYNGHTVTDPSVNKALANISVYEGSRIVEVTSGDRNFVPTGGAKNSAHLTGNAADFHVAGMSDSQVHRPTVFVHEGMSPKQTGVYSHDPN